ncbi:MAG: hypothetical protein KDB01_11945 [Planctomycetaceae bacterium]|nr:hypothetical protein [Planctomycetaceae bacterium]
MSLGTLPRVVGLQEILNRCQRLIWVYTFLRGTAETLCVLIACVLFGCLLDYLLVLPGVVRMTGLTATLLLTLGVAWKRLVRPLTGSAPAEELAAAVDLRFPELHESIATLISIKSQTATNSESGSDWMQNRLEQQVRSQIDSIHPTEVVRGRPAIKRWGMAAISVMAILIPLLLWPSGSQLLLQRFAMPFANLAAPTNLYFQVPLGSRTVAVNSDVPFLATPHWRTGSGGRVPNDVTVEIDVPGGSSQLLAMEYDDREAQFSASLTDIRSSVRFRICGGGATTEWFDLTVADPPRVLTAVLKATPPTYSGRPAETFDGIVGEMHVFQNSAIEMALTFNKPVQKVEIDWETWIPISVPGDTPAEQSESSMISPAVLSADGRSALFRFDAIASGEFDFRVEDSLGLTNLKQTRRHLIVTTDAPPKLIVTGIHDGLDVRPDDVLPLNCVATDDVGVGELQMHLQRNAEAESIHQADGFVRGGLRAAHDFQIDLKSLGVQDGDVLTLKVRAADERPIPGPQEVWQGPWTIRISESAAAIGQTALREADQKLIEALRSIEQQLLQDSLKAVALKDQLTQESNDERRQAIRALSENEQTQGRTLQSLAEETATHPLMKRQATNLTQLAQDMRHDVANRLEAVATATEQEAALRDMQESINQLNRIREELHRVIDDIEQAAQLEQELAELNRLALEARQLAHDSQKLQQQRENGHPEAGQSEEDHQTRLSETQRQLQQEQQELTTDLGKLLQRRKELLQAAREAELDRAAKIAGQTRRLAQQQQQLAEGITENASVEPDDSASAATEDRLAESDVAEKLLNDLAKMTAAARETADSVRATHIEPTGAKKDSDQAAERADEALRHAAAGQFGRATERMRDAADASDHAADHIPDAVHQDLRERLQQQRDNFNRMSKVVEQLENNGPAKVATQKSTQQNVAAAAALLPETLRELAERLSISELGLQDQATPADEAVQAAQNGARSSEAASERLNESQLQQAGEESEDASQHLQHAADLTEQAAQGHREPDAIIPGDVGESVSDALQSLKRAEKMMGEESRQPADADPSGSNPDDATGQSGAEGQSDFESQSGSEALAGNDESGAPREDSDRPGEAESAQTQSAGGQPGQRQAGDPQGKPGSSAKGKGQQANSAEQLARAAKSLNAAARGALPKQFSPGQLSTDPDGASGEPAAEGHVSEFDGQSPGATRRHGSGRRWGGLHDALDADVSDAGKEVLDSEYSELIQRYRRDLARSGQNSLSKPDAEK